MHGDLHCDRVSELDDCPNARVARSFESSLDGFRPRSLPRRTTIVPDRQAGIGPHSREGEEKGRSAFHMDLDARAKSAPVGVVAR